MEQQVRQASNDWFDALMSGDLDSVDQLETDDFLTVQQAAGAVAVVNKNQQLENLRKAGDNRPKFQRDLSAIKVRAYGTAAVLTALATYRQPGPRQRVAAGQAVITEVWVNDGGRWRLAHVQQADIPARTAR